MAQNKVLRVVFMGTPEFAIPAFEAIHSRGEFSQVVAVFTQPDRPFGRGQGLKPPPLKTKALSFQIPVFQPARLEGSPEMQSLRELNPDVIVVVAYGQILKKEVLELPKLGCVNVHSSLLPRWRGAAPIQWAILGGDSETGVTTMRIAEKLDTGNILLQARTPIHPQDTAGSLHDRLAVLGGEIIIPTLEGLARGTLKEIPQNEADVTIASKLKKEMEILDPFTSADQLDRQIRALNPWPGTSLTLKSQFKSSQGERIKIREACPRMDIHGSPAILFEKAGMLLLGTAKGSLELRRLQWEGKKESDAASFLNGLQGKGLRLPLEIRTKLT